MTPEMTTGNTPPAPMDGAPTIADISYRNYEGPLQAHALRWWVVALSTLRQAFGRQKVGYWIIASLIGIRYLIHGGWFYFSRSLSNIAKTSGMGFDPFGGQNPFALAMDWGQANIQFLVFVAAILLGASSIAADNRANALLVYLSKPITKADYLIGKWVGLFLALWTLVLIPNLLLYFFLLFTYMNDGFLKDNPHLLWRTVVASAIPPLLMASMILGFSAWSRQPRIIAAIFAAVYIVTGFAFPASALVLLLRDKETKNDAAISVVFNASLAGIGPALAMHVYDVNPAQAISAERQGRRRKRKLSEWEQGALRLVDRPPLAPIAGLAFLCVVLPLAAAVTKIRAVEVISG